MEFEVFESFEQGSENKKIRFLGTYSYAYKRYIPLFRDAAIAGFIKMLIVHRVDRLNNWMYPRLNRKGRPGYVLK